MTKIQHQSSWPTTNFSLPPCLRTPDLRGVTIGAVTVGKKARISCTSPLAQPQISRYSQHPFHTLSLQSTWAVVLLSSIRTTKSSSNETHLRKASTGVFLLFGGGLVLSCLASKKFVDAATSFTSSSIRPNSFFPLRTCDPRPSSADVAPNGISLKSH